MPNGRPTYTPGEGRRGAEALTRPSLGPVHRSARDTDFVASLTYGGCMPATSAPTPVAQIPTPAASPVDVGLPVLGSLSPSRASDFMACPLLYRFRVIDKLPERPSPAAVRGTVVHAALERLFDLPAAQRSLEAAGELIEPAWLSVLADRPE